MILETISLLLFVFLFVLHSDRLSHWQARSRVNNKALKVTATFDEVLAA